ncbi:MAG TPA: membrane protein insertase YidC [Solirubrobacteraceae bacterium]|nr:membrane protein insertase YidC [Solirubrobacteraceae bacterium]
MPILANVIQDAFSPLITVFEHLLVFIHGIVGNWGWAIVGMTMVVRAVLVPLTYRQLKSMQEMQRLSPELQALKEKYKDDKQRQQEEMMKLYRERGVNPFGACLPLLLQLPVFISLFYMLRTDLKNQICGPQMISSYEKALGQPVKQFSDIPEHATKITSATAQNVSGITQSASHMVKGLSEVGCNVVAPGSAHFLFLPDITEKATGAALIALIIVYVASQVGSTLIATASADPNQRRLMLFLPLIFVIILYRYPSGLLVYWITTNIWTVCQQLVIRRRMPPPVRPQVDPSQPKKSFRESLESAVGNTGAQKPAPAAAEAPTPPPPPRKKKKKSGRRR